MMKKTIRLTESDLNRLVTKVINEGKKYEFIDEHPNYKEFKTKIKELKKMMKSIEKDFSDGDEYIKEFIMDELL
jgi:exoribonuclease II